MRPGMRMKVRNAARIAVISISGPTFRGFPEAA